MAEKTPVGNMPRMVPDRDDIRSRHARNASESKPTAPSGSNKGEGGTSWVMVVLFLVAGAAIAYLALQQYSMTQLLNSYEERLDLADERIVKMEQALTETDESVAMNGTAINAQFKAIKTETDLHMSEIRKLWDITNKRNKLWIEENQTKLASQVELTEKQAQAIAKLETTLTADQAIVAELGQQLATERTEIDAINQNLLAMNDEIASAMRAIETLMKVDYEDQLLTMKLTQETLLAEQGGLAKNMKANTNQLTEVNASLQSIDASRLETSRRLSALTDQLDSLAARVAALTGGVE